MKVFVPRILTGLLACLIVAQTVQAQTNPPLEPVPQGTVVPEPVASPPLINDAPGSVVVQNYFGYTDVDRTFEPLMRVDTRGGSLMGQQGFTRVSGILPHWADDSTLLFVDLGGFATYRPAGGANVGFGWRGYFDDLDRIFGVNAWYDFDAGHQDQYHQFGVGFESLGRYIDYRVNGYIPFGGTSNLLSNGIITGGNPTFLNHFIYLDRYYRHETAYRGFDAEMGGPVPFLGRYGLSAFAGMYFFTGLNVGNITGVTGRLTGQVNEDLTVGAQFSHDNVFDNNVQIQVTWTIPDGGSSRWFRQQTVRDRMTAPVLRNYRILANDEVVVVSEKAINPIDGLPYFVDHIDPNRTPGTGNGTVENPFSLISQFDNRPLGEKSNVDIVYVRPRTIDPNDRTSQLNTGVTLLSDQRLLSTSVAHLFDVIPAQADVNGNTVYGLPTIPAFPLGSALPVLSNINGGDVVTLTTGAHNIEVSGFEIRGNRLQPNHATGTNLATNNGIAGIDNQEVKINRNIINQAVHGVYLQNLSGTVAAGTASIFDLNFFTPFDDENITGDEALANDGEGLFVLNDGADPLEVFLTRNTAWGNFGNGFSFVARNGSSIGGIISGNRTEVTDPESGNVTSLENGNSGLFLAADNGAIDFFNPVRGWQIGGLTTIAADDGLSVYAANFAAVPLDQSNIFSGNGSHGVHVLSLNDSDVSVRFINNDMSRNDLNGLAVRATSGAANIAIGGPLAEQGNRFENNGLNGIWMELQGTVQAQLNIQNNFINGNGNNGAGGGSGSGVSLYDINVVFGGGLTPSQQAIFALAAQKWESIIVGDVPDINGIDDVQISATGQAIDGSGGILGAAGPTALRPGSFLPYLGEMVFDTADLADLEASGQLDEVILHEMAHVIGFGTIWTDLNLLTGAGTNDPQFTGTNAVREYNDRFNQNGTGVPVENTGGQGTADAHWRESVFNNELMTGFLNSGVPNPISRVTVGQWQDLGYQVNYNNAEPYSRQSGNSAALQLGQVLRPAVSVSAPPVVQNTTNLVPVGTPVGDGIQITLDGNATLAPSTIQNNTVTANARHGMYLDAAGTSNVPNLVIYNNTFNNNGTGTAGSGLFLQRRVDATLHADVRHNDMSSNLADGFSLNAAGTPLPPVVVNMSDNTLNNNARHGLNAQTDGAAILRVTSDRDNFDSNTSSNQFFNAGQGSILNGVFNNASINDSGVDGVTIFSTGLSDVILRYDSPTDPLYVGPGTTISNNNGNGITANALQLSHLTLRILETGHAGQGLNTVIDSNAGAGVQINRSGASLTETLIDGVDITNNTVAGIQFIGRGSHPSDPTQPSSPEPNRLNILNSTVDNNGIGLDVDLRADPVLVVHAISSTFDHNVGDGVRVFAGDDSSFGNVDSGERSVFNNVSMSHNGDAGMHLFAMGNNSNRSNIYVEVNSLLGDTFITDNGGDGILASAPQGTINLLVTGSSLIPALNNTFIQRNGDNGIEFNVANIAQDGGDDEIIVAKFPDNPNFPVIDLTSFDSYSGEGFLTLDTVTIGDIDPVTGTSNGNAGDGIHLFVSNSNDFATTATAIPDLADFFFIINRAGTLEVNINQTLIANNGDDGIDLLSQGNDFTFATGNLITMNVTNSRINQNGASSPDDSGDGVHILLNGKHGSYDLDFFAGTYTRTSQNEFYFDGNTIDSNRGYGFYYEANAGAMQRPDLTNHDLVNPNLFWAIEFADPGVNPGPGTVYDPDAIGTTSFFPAYNAGYAAPVFLSDYLNLTTDINSHLVFTNNLVRFNGDPSTSTGDGMWLRLGTNSYLAADIGGAAGGTTGNVFTGNANADFRTSSFVAYDRDDPLRTPIQPPVSVPGNDTAAPPVLDKIWLDDTAQMDLRFNNNTGRKVDTKVIFVIGPEGSAGLRTAAYDNVDQFKGSPDGQIRPTQIFQVDDGLNLNANNNWGPQDIEFEMNVNGNIHLRTVADPLFPNPAFPENYFADPGDPFLP